MGTFSDEFVYQQDRVFNSDTKERWNGSQRKNVHLMTNSEKFMNKKHFPEYLEKN